MGEVVARIMLLCCFDALAKKLGLPLLSDAEVTVNQFLGSLTGAGWQVYKESFTAKLLQGKNLHFIMLIYFYYYNRAYFF